jgi:acyl carrier protein
MKPTEAEVLQAIQQIATQELHMAREIHPSHALFGDLELDSITIVTLLASLENRYRVCLPPTDSVSLQTVGDVIRSVLEASQGAPS